MTGVALDRITPGTDLVPDGWCESTVIPWADEQEEEEPLAQATARLAGMIAAYRTLNADALELVKARRYIEVRWGELLGAPIGPDRKSDTREVSDPTPLTANERSQFRTLAAEPAVVEAIVTATTDGELTRAALLRVAKDNTPEPAERKPPKSAADDPDAPYEELEAVTDAVRAAIEAGATKTYVRDAYKAGLSQHE